jgi:hypothetical protein
MLNFQDEKNVSHRSKFGKSEKNNLFEAMFT